MVVLTFHLRKVRLVEFVPVRSTVEDLVLNLEQQETQLSFIFFISSFFQRVSSTTTVGYLIYVVCAMLSMLSSSFYMKTTPPKYVILFSILLPPLPLGGGINLLKEAIKIGGIRWSDVFKATKCGQDSDFPYAAILASCISMMGYIKWLPASFFAYLMLALYFDNILPNSCGVGKPLHYFLKPSYWTGVEREVQNLEKEAPASSTYGEDESVVEEKYTVRRQVEQGNVDENVAVQLRGLAKTYTSFKIIPPKLAKFKALKGMWINFAKDQLFCMLGSNGAGKTTAIGCLTGMLPVTRGDAIVFGNSVRSPASMANIRRMTGVCSQFDTLWSKLTGLEHLELFACIKGLPPSMSRSVCSPFIQTGM
ncbi:ATP-binding cassette [Lithospermum erythrorhizon]|uniref:ATP-binding cassette n=1 Tax=Lithospermum erythrorhizon TaxID=34254 RepID=A0AAV3NNG0_LITER